MKPLFLLPLFAAAALAQQPLDQPRSTLCGQQTAMHDIVCADFGPINIGGFVQLPKRQMQIFVKLQPNASAYRLVYRTCDSEGKTMRQGLDLSPSVAIGGEPNYAGYFQILPVKDEFVCEVEVRSLYL